MKMSCCLEMFSVFFISAENEVPQWKLSYFLPVALLCLPWSASAFDFRSGIIFHYLNCSFRKVTELFKKQPSERDVLVVTVGWLHALFTPADHINCIHMPIVRFLCDSEGQFKHQLCNIWLGRSHRLNGKVITWVLLNRFQSLVLFKSQKTNKKILSPMGFMIVSVDGINSWFDVELITNCGKISQHGLNISSAEARARACVCECERASLVENCSILEKALTLILQHSSLMVPLVISRLIGTRFW